ncbi:MAG: hypothetical protein ABL994_11035, partial [Verrucomicrobiales bacterium]
MMKQSFSLFLALWVSALAGVTTLSAQDVVVDQYGTEYAPDLLPKSIGSTRKSTPASTSAAPTARSTSAGYLAPQ